MFLFSKAINNNKIIFDLFFLKFFFVRIDFRFHFAGGRVYSCISYKN